jgi:hypothetical protein
MTFSPAPVSKVPNPSPGHLNSSSSFADCNKNLSRTTLLAHPDPSAPLALVTDASTSAMGAALQQRVHSAWQPLAFFSRKHPYPSEVRRV